MKILIINGPSLNMLGVREPTVYGNRTYSELCEFIADVCSKLGVEHKTVQSNHEGTIIDQICSAYGVYDGIVINPAAYTHTSIAIADAVAAVGIPCVEVHLTDINNREDFRKISYVRSKCIASISGHGFDGYKEAVELLSEKHKKTTESF